MSDLGLGTGETLSEHDATVTRKLWLDFADGMLSGDDVLTVAQGQGLLPEEASTITINGREFELPAGNSEAIEETK